MRGRRRPPAHGCSSSNLASCRSPPACIKVGGVTRREVLVHISFLQGWAWGPAGQPYLLYGSPQVNCCCPYPVLLPLIHPSLLSHHSSCSGKSPFLLLTPKKDKFQNHFRSRGKGHTNWRLRKKGQVFLGGFGEGRWGKKRGWGERVSVIWGKSKQKNYPPVLFFEAVNHGRGEAFM